MSHGVPSKPAPPTRKRKWKAAHVVKIDLGDDESDGEGVSTAVVQQASRDGRRLIRQLHPILVPRDTPPPAASYDHPSAEEMGFAMDIIGETDGEDEPDEPVSLQVSHTHLCFLRLKLRRTVG